MKSCSLRGCGVRASWQIGLMLYAPAKHGKVPVNAEMELFVCEDHSKGLKTEDDLTEEGWLKILAAFRRARKVPPDRSLTMLNFIPL